MIVIPPKRIVLSFNLLVNLSIDGIKFAMEVQGGTEAVQSAVSFNWSLLFIKKSTTLKAVLLTDANTQPRERGTLAVSKFKIVRVSSF